MPATRYNLSTARPMSTMTTSPPLSIRLRESSKLRSFELVVTWNKEELVEKFEEKVERDRFREVEGAGEGWWWADMMGATERGRHPGDPGHMGEKLEKLKYSSRWQGFLRGPRTHGREAGKIEMYIQLGKDFSEDEGHMEGWKH